MVCMLTAPTVISTFIVEGVYKTEKHVQLALCIITSMVPAIQIPHMFGKLKFKYFNSI